LPLARLAINANTNCLRFVGTKGQEVGTRNQTISIPNTVVKHPGPMIVRALAKVGIAKFYFLAQTARGFARTSKPRRDSSRAGFFHGRSTNSPLLLVTLELECDNWAMTIPANHLTETALSLSQSERADLALHLLQSLTPPGNKVTDEDFGQQLHERVQDYRSGKVSSSSLDETRTIIEQAISTRPQS